MSEIYARTHLAWLIWCFSEDYTTAFDREIIENWLLLEDWQLDPADVKLRDNLLVMADEVLAALRTEG